MIDIAEPVEIEIATNHDGSTVWVNVNGVCQFRACKIKNLTFDFKHTGKNVLPEGYISADDAAAMLNLSKKVFLNLSNRGDIKGQTVYAGKRVWKLDAIEATIKELESF